MGSGKGGGGSAQPQSMQTTSTVNQSNLPEYARPYFESLMQRAQGVSNEGYVPYGGQRLADLTGQQQWGLNLTNANVGSYKPHTDAAGASINSANFDPTQISNTFQAQQWTDPGVSQSYMSPYIQNVLDRQKTEAFRDYNIQQQQRNAQAQAGGAFGGYRHGIMESEAARNLNTQLQDIEARGLEGAYNTGLGAFNQDRGALATQGQMDMAAAQANNQFGLNAAQMDLQRGQTQAGLGQLIQGLGQADVQSLMNAGAIQQAQQQAGLDIAYQDFINQRDFPRQNLNWLSGILRGVPVGANSSVTNYQAAPSQVSQLTGLGLGAAGLAKMLG